MKKLITVLTAFSLSATGFATTYNVISCTKPATDIRIDTYDTIQLTPFSTGSFSVLNYNDLSKMRITTDDKGDNLSFKINNGAVVIKAKKYTENPVTVTINAKNANKPVRIKVKVNALIPNYADQFYFLTNSVSGLLSYLQTLEDENFANIIGLNVPVFGIIGMALNGLIDKINLNPEKIDIGLKIAKDAIDLSAYSGMNSQQALDASGIRIANGLGVLSGQYSLTDSSKPVVDWKSKNDKEAFKSSMEVYSNSISGIIDTFSSRIKWDKNDSIINNIKKILDLAISKASPEQVIYFLTQILASQNLLIYYMNMFDLSNVRSQADLITYDKIKEIRNKPIDVTTEIDLSKSVKSFVSLLSSQYALRSLIGILFSINSNKDTGSDAFFNVLGKKGLAYDENGNYKLYDDTYGISPIIGNTITGLFKSNFGDVIMEKIKSVLPSIVTGFINIKLVSSIAANSPILLLNYLANGINSDKVVLVDATLKKFTLTGSDSILNLLYDGDKPKINIPFTKQQLETILKDPIGFIYKNINDVDGKDFDKIKLKDIKGVFNLTDQDLINIFGPKALDLKLDDVVNAIVNNIDDITFTFNKFAPLISKLLEPVKSKNGTDISLINYILANQNELVDQDSNLWKYIGLVVDGKKFSIKADSLLSVARTMFKDQNLIGIISSLGKIVSSLNDLSK